MHKLYEISSTLEAEPETLKRARGGGGVLYVGHGWLTKEILDKRWSKKANIMLKVMFMAKYFYKCFQSFSIFIYNERLPVKSYQFFNTYK